MHLYCRGSIFIIHVYDFFINLELTKGNLKSFGKIVFNPLQMKNIIKW